MMKVKLKVGETERTFTAIELTSIFNALGEEKINKLKPESIRSPIQIGIPMNGTTLFFAMEHVVAVIKNYYAQEKLPV